MKKADLIKQLANRINQPHVVESWINKIQNAAYKKGVEDGKKEQLELTAVSQRSEPLQAVEDLKDWCYDTCNASNRDRLYEILDRL
jgi:hypothetical protein